MKITSIPQQKIELKNLQNQNETNTQLNGQAPQFTGLGSALITGGNVLLRFLDTNQAWGANLVDVGSMVIPRTAYDMTKRGFSLGLETGRREATGTFNHAMVGVYGTAAGALMAFALNRAYDIKAHKIFANNETLNILGSNWYDALKSDEEDPLRKYLSKTVSKIKVFNPAGTENEDGYKTISKEVREQVADKLYDLIKNGNRETIAKDDVNYLKALITADTGAEKSVILEGVIKGENIKAGNTLQTLLENIHNVTRAFTKEKVQQSFKSAENFADINILNSLKRLNIKRSVAGLGFAAMFGMSVQPVNMYLTKKKTGCDGFPGIPGRNKDKSSGFQVLKTTMAALFGIGAISTIMIGDKRAAGKTAKTFGGKLKNFANEFLAKIQFKGMMPTINQLKFVYGMTIMSRFMCARDKDELRESAVKDSLGFLNLLILGSLISKVSTRALNKELINLPKNAKKGFLSWMKNSSVKSRDEVLLETLKKNGIAVTKDGKALSYGELLDAAKTIKDEAVRKDLNKKLRHLNIAQLIGYAYSGIFLGYYLPKINQKMSEANEAKRIARLAKEQGRSVEEIKAELEVAKKEMEAKSKGLSIEKPESASKLQPAAKTVSMQANPHNFFEKHMTA